MPNNRGDRRRPTDAELDALTTPDVLAANAQRAVQRWNDDGTAAGDAGMNGLLEAETTDAEKKSDEPIT